jgi:hypothetical protein
LTPKYFVCYSRLSVFDKGQLVNGITLSRYAMQAPRGTRVTALLILYLGTRYYPQYQPDRRLGGPQEMVWMQRLEEKSFASPRDQTLVVQSVVRHYIVSVHKNIVSMVYYRPFLARKDRIL